MSDAHDDDRFDRDQHPELAGLFLALDELSVPPADPSLRAAQIQRAGLAARGALPAPAPWSWTRAVSWRAAAIAAAAVVVVIGGLGADDRLPEPAQKAVSSVADAVGIDLPDGSDRNGSVAPDGAPPTSADTGESGTTPATPATPGGHGEPATPATPADPGNDDGSSDGNERSEHNDTPATPADPGAPDEPTAPATPPTSTPPTSGPPVTPTVPDRGDEGDGGEGNRSDEDSTRDGKDRAPATLPTAQPSPK